jgi:hypothetical protein
MGTGRDIADRYVEVATSDGRGQLADLFAVDGVLHSPDGMAVHGREAIRAYYDEHLAHQVPDFRIGHAVETADACWIELEAPDGSGGHRMVATDHFSIAADGLVTRMAVFLRPQPK